MKSRNPAATAGADGAVDRLHPVASRRRPGAPNGAGDGRLTLAKNLPPGSGFFRVSFEVKVKGEHRNFALGKISPKGKFPLFTFT